MRLRWWSFLFCIACAAGCNKQRALIDDAAKRHARGDLSGALDLLDQAGALAPGAVEAAEARQLGASWAIEAADAAPSDSERRPLLERSIAFQPKSGAAGARLCALAKADGIDALSRCVAGLAAMDDVPEAIAAPLRRDVAEHTATVERARLLDSASIEDWRALVTRYAGSAEATLAADKIRGATSICGALDGTFGIAQPIGELERTASTARDTVRGTSHVEAWVAELHELEKPVAAYRDRLQRARDAVKAHPIQPGEEPVRASLAGDFDEFAQVASKWNDALRTPDVKINDQGDVALTIPEAAVADAFKRAADATVDARKHATQHEEERRTQCAALGATTPPK